MKKTDEDEFMLPQVVYHEEKDFKKDPLFKCVIDDPENDEDAYYITEGIIEGTVGKVPDQIVEMNTELSPENFTNKFMRTDVLLDAGKLGIVNIEMQDSDYSKGHNIRFQRYHSELVLMDNQRGEFSYSENARVINQIIFMNAVNRDWQQLIKSFTLRSEEGDEFPNALIRVYIVQIPYINEVAKGKPLKEFNRLEMFTYVLANGEENAIMEINHRVVDIMERKRNQYNTDAILLAMKHNQEMKEAANREMLKEEITEQVTKEVTEQITKEVTEQVMEEGIKKGIVEGKQEGEKEGVYKNQRELTMSVFKMKYPHVDVALIDNLTLKQYKVIFNLLLYDAPLEKIKAVIH